MARISGGGGENLKKVAKTVNQVAKKLIHLVGVWSGWAVAGRFGDAMQPSGPGGAM